MAVIQRSYVYGKLSFNFKFLQGRCALLRSRPICLQFLWWLRSPGPWKLSRGCRITMSFIVCFFVYLFLLNAVKSFLSIFTKDPLQSGMLQRWLGCLTSCLPTPVGREFVFTANEIMWKKKIKCLLGKSVPINKVSENYVVCTTQETYLKVESQSGWSEKT